MAAFARSCRCDRTSKRVAPRLHGDCFRYIRVHLDVVRFTDRRCSRAAAVQIRVSAPLSHDGADARAHRHLRFSRLQNGSNRAAQESSVGRRSVLRESCRFPDLLVPIYVARHAGLSSAAGDVEYLGGLT